MDEVIKAIFEEFQGNRDEMIPLLQRVQETYSYLPDQAMKAIARFIHLPESKVYGVATFYSQFRFKPRGKKHAMVCRGTACHVNGAPRILEEIEETIDSSLIGGIKVQIGDRVFDGSVRSSLSDIKEALGSVKL